LVKNLIHSKEKEGTWRIRGISHLPAVVVIDIADFAL